MEKNILFFFKNVDIYHGNANWRGAVLIGVVGWIFGLLASISLGISSKSWLLTKWSFIFPILGLIIAFIQLTLGTRRYFIPSLISLTTSSILTIWLSFIFTWVGLFNFLPLIWWVMMLLVSLFLHYIIWHYNQIEFESAKQYIIELYHQNKLGFDDLDTYRHVRSSPLWLKKAEFWFFLIGLIALGVGRFANLAAGGKVWYTPYGLAGGVIFLNLIFVNGTARLYGQIRPAIAAAKQLKTEGL